MARKVNEVVSILKDAIAKIEDKNPLQQPSTSSGPSDISTECFSDTYILNDFADITIFRFRFINPRRCRGEGFKVSSFV